MSARLGRLAALVVLAPFLAGAHCSDDCASPVMRLNARNLERTLYGPGVVTLHPLAALLAPTLAPFERRELRIDPSRPIAVVLANAASARAVAGLDPGSLKAGGRGDGFRVIAILDHAGKVPLFDDAAQLAEAERERWDAVVLVPRERGVPWAVSVVVDVGRRVERRNDPDTGRCVDQGPAGPALPSFTILNLPVTCGDHVVQDEEECDDGNRKGGDGCSPYCFKER
jgi:cysteine-rich repeat protein